MSMFPIASLYGNGSATSFLFSNIPQTFTHLQIRITARVNNGTYDNFLQLNSDATANNYSYHELQGDGTSASSYGAANAGAYNMYPTANTNQTTGVFSSWIVDILDYTNTNKYKTIKGFGGYDNNGSGVIRFSSAGYFSLSAISSINIVGGTQAYLTGSVATLYGISTSGVTGA